MCTSGQKKITGLQQPKSPDDIPDYVDEVRGAIEGTANDLKGLDRPSGDAGKQAREFVDAFEQDIKQQYSPKFEAMKQAAQNGSRQQLLKAYRELQAVQTPKSDKLASDIGAPACGT
jgi:hypothetical protein